MNNYRPSLQLLRSTTPLRDSGKADLSGIDLFWKIVQILEKDAIPGENLWNELFNTPGFRFLSEKEGKRGVISKCIALAFMPSQERETKTYAYSNSDRYIRHFQEIKRHKEQLIQFQEEIYKRDIIAESFSKAKEYIPENQTIDKITVPHLSFAFFEPAIKSNQEMMVVDFLHAYSIDIVPAIANRLHQNFLHEITRFSSPNPDHDDYPILRAVIQLQKAGIADLIDKKELLRNMKKRKIEEDWYISNYKTYYRNAPKTLKRVDELIQQMAKTSGAKWKKGDEIWRLLSLEAHPQGSYMAVLIEKELGKEALLKTLDNPFEFIRLYNMAATQNAEHSHIFSRESMQYLIKLENQYIQAK